MQGHAHFSIQDIRLLELVDAVADLFPLNAEIRQIGGVAAPELFINWRTAGVFGRKGNFSWGVLFRFTEGAIEQYECLDAPGRESAHSELRKLAQDLRFSYDGSDGRSLFVVDVPESLFDAVIRGASDRCLPADREEPRLNGVQNGVQTGRSDPTPPLRDE
jgi:hypothetical protein